MKERVSGYREDHYFKRFNEIGRADNDWRVILQCPECNQLWLVDVFDKVQSLFAFKIDSPKDTERSFFAVHKKYLIESRGGYSQKKCVMAGCENRGLMELVYCPECAINKLGIYE
jgi:hypothetical protein